MGQIVLLVNDDEDVLGLLQALLRDVPGAIAVTAGSAQEALVKACTLLPQVVLTAEMLPDATRLELVARLRVEPATSATSVILFTSGATGVEPMPGERNVFPVEAPFDISSLTALVGDCLCSTQFKTAGRVARLARTA